MEILLALLALTDQVPDETPKGLVAAGHSVSYDCGGFCNCQCDCGNCVCVPN